LFGLAAPIVAGGDQVSSSVEEKVISIVAEQLGVPKEEVTLESSIIEDLKADSLDVVELVMELEDEFDITIPDDDYEKLRTVGDAIRYIESKR
jgi:acyl carrier protein